jgi:single-strand DNA-binding protein
MASVNRVILVGFLGHDPKLAYTTQGKAVCELSIATNEVWKDKSGERQERTEWHRAKVWGDHAESCSKYLAKGRMVYVEGKLQTRSYEDKQGQKRYVTEIIADRVVFLGGGDGGQRGEQRETPGTAGSAGKPREVNGGDEQRRAAEPPPGYGDDDIPF